MRCEQIQEMILSDYLDGQMADHQKQQVDQHIHQCEQCQEFLKVAKVAAFDPFMDIPLIEPPEQIWKNIEHRIIQEKVAEVSRSGWMKNIYIRFQLPFALATVCGLILMVISTLYQPKQIAVKTEIEQNASVEIALLTVSDYYMDSDEELNFGTMIEEYFL